MWKHELIIDDLSKSVCVKFETGQNLLPVLKIITHTAHVGRIC